MKILLGVDGQRQTKDSPYSCSLIERLRFPAAEIKVLSVLTPPAFGDWGIDIVLTSDSFEALEEAKFARARVLQANAVADMRCSEGAGDHGRDTITREIQRSRSIPGAILECADRWNAGLIAVDGPHRGGLGPFLTGSVARSLVIESHRHSLLLTKAPRENQHDDEAEPASETAETAASPPNRKPLEDTAVSVRAIFATDHSPYANRCVDTLIHMAPRGISHITILTAYPEKKLMRIGQGLPDLTAAPETAVHQWLTEQNYEVVRRLSPLLEAAGATCASCVSRAPVNEAIAYAMEEDDAELLILGARGHGFIDRVTLGSVSFHQAMATPHSLLVLRP